MATLTKDELIERQRVESLKTFTEKSVAIQKEISGWEEKLKSIKELFSTEYNKKLDEIKSLEEELRQKLHEANDKDALAIAMLKDVQVKMTKAIATEEALKVRESAHAENVESHAENSTKDKDDILNRHAVSMEREDKSRQLLIDADKRMADAIAKEQSISEQAGKLIAISDSIAKDIAIHKELQNQNETLKAEIVALKIEVDKDASEANALRAEAVKIRDDCDAAQSRLTRIGQEIEKRNADCKAWEIRNQVTDQLLKDRKSALDSQEGRLNELKNNVNALLEKQQANVLAPKEGV